MWLPRFVRIVWGIKNRYRSMCSRTRWSGNIAFTRCVYYTINKPALVALAARMKKTLQLRNQVIKDAIEVYKRCDCSRKDKPKE